jgi:RimJ/RimL family protein N-acetyltransferase
MDVPFSHREAAVRDALGRGHVLARSHSLKDGTPVRLRQLHPEDAEELRAAFDRLSPESRYMRFFAPIRRLPEPMLRRLVATDGWSHVALVAETIPLYDEPPEPLGVVRFIRSKDRAGVAEVAISVIDELHNRGLGRVLLGAIAEIAREQGVTRFVATVLAENAPMNALLRKLGPIASVEHEHGALVYEIELSRARRSVPLREVPAGSS